jgi:hypothetical protein
VLGMSAFSVYGLQNFFVGNIDSAAEVSKRGAAGGRVIASGAESLRKPGFAETGRGAERQMELDSVLGCVIAADVCRCWGEGHRTLKLSRKDCLATAREPIRSSASALAVLSWQDRFRARGPGREDAGRAAQVPKARDLLPLAKLAGGQE